jgi:hypothetical protein
MGLHHTGIYISKTISAVFKLSDTFRVSAKIPAQAQNRMPHFKVMDKLITIIAYILTCSSNILGQNQPLTIYFDTLHPHPSTPFFILTSRPTYDEDYGVYMLQDTVAHTLILKDLEPHLKFQIVITNFNDSVELLIPFDNNGGFLKISNLKAAKNGIIRFDKWTVYSNCLKDTILYKTEYYKRNPEDSLPKPFKVTKKTEAVKKTCIRKTPHYKTAFKINDQLYLVSLQTKLIEQTVRHGHGYHKDIYKPYPKNKKLIFRHTIQEHRKYSNEISIRLRHEA